MELKTIFVKEIKTKKKLYFCTFKTWSKEKKLVFRNNIYYVLTQKYHCKKKI